MDWPAGVAQSHQAYGQLGRGRAGGVLTGDGGGNDSFHTFRTSCCPFVGIGIWNIPLMRAHIGALRRETDWEEVFQHGLCAQPFCSGWRGLILFRKYEIISVLSFSPTFLPIESRWSSSRPWHNTTMGSRSDAEAWRGSANRAGELR